jgi:hypothetical protein
MTFPSELFCSSHMRCGDGNIDVFANRKAIPEAILLLSLDYGEVVAIAESASNGF